MYVSAEGAKVQSQRLETIANNLANLETPGFKRDVPSFQARFAEAIQQGFDFAGSQSENNVGGGVKLIETLTDFSRGTLRGTDVPTDFAINGDGFFHVRTPEGESLLTKAGDFLIDTQGTLQTQIGRFNVLDSGGGEIQLNPQQPWQFLAGGIIEQDGQRYPLGLQKPESLGDLVKVGNNMFRPLAPTTEVPAAQRDIRQGYLEQSGVSSTLEMMAMIETTRAFEANSRMIQNQDSMQNALISRVLTS
jgi:flagellar basal body rod protein FlgG